MSKKKGVAILGSTGSIGMKAVDIIATFVRRSLHTTSRANPLAGNTKARIVRMFIRLLFIPEAAVNLHLPLSYDRKEIVPNQLR